MVKTEVEIFFRAPKKIIVKRDIAGDITDTTHRSAEGCTMT